jgi:branched-chain amino acid transport system ATP-binding protein
MLALARALRGDPNLLLLDEPTEGLAPQIVQTVVGAIEEIVAEDKTVLLVEQNAEVALDLASHAYIIDRGEVVFNGSPADVRASQPELEAYLGVGRSE